MPKYDIEGLKGQRKSVESRHADLLLAFLPFREAFLALLERFVEDAKSGGLEDVKPLKERGKSEDQVEYSLTLNGFDLIVISTDQAHKLDPMKEHLASRILIYTSELDEARPFADIVFREYSEDLWTAYMQWFTTEGSSPITGTMAFSNDQAINHGEEFAEVFIGHMYQFENSWREKPTLGAMRHSKTDQTTIGFQTDGA